MKNKIIILVLCAFVVIGALPITALAAQNTEDIIILYENDVHCEVDGYSKLSALKKELKEDYAHVGAVSCGDFIQGSSLGVVSRGEYIVKLMNLVGYDAITLGNHEFDYHLPRLEELTGMMDTKPICCNFRKISEPDPYFEPYSIVKYGDVEIAYIGITTPSTITSTSPAQFKDEAGNYIYTFHPNDLYEVVQSNIDAALSDGADYVIALSHVGDSEPIYDVEELIANTTGLDVVLDGHSHSVIEQRIVNDASQNAVVLSSTGTKFEHIGKLTISGDEIKTELVKTEEYEKTDPVVDAYLKQIDEEYSALGDRKVAFSEVDLITHDADGNRLVRNTETNLGDLCADALRSFADSDIGYINGGGIRAAIPAGEVTFNDLLNVFPFNNTVVIAKMDGQTFRDMLEMAMLSWPLEGSFPHVSGVTFSLNTEIESSVILNENEEFCGVSGQYRVYNIRIFNRETQKYEPIDPNKTYTIASNNYYLVDYGSGMTMLEKVEIVQDDGTLDVEALERYIVEDLGGVIGEKYREVEKSITFTEGEVYPVEALTVVLWVACATVGAAAIGVAVVLILKRGKSSKAQKENDGTENA